MISGNELDLNTLSWVKSELDETLNQARSALELYVDDSADDTQLQFVKNYLHQVRGTLQMVELYGAAMAAEEMEAVTEALIESQINNRNDAYEVLMRGILQLPDYLEHLLSGHRDMPMVLLPLLNDLRASRGEALLSENALFNPDLNIKAPMNDAITGENLSELARKLRHNYHLGLLGWFRDRDSDASLARIAEVIDQLRESATEEEVNRLLWVAGGLVESLRQGGLDSNVSIKLLLGQLDRQFKKIIDNGVTALSHEPPYELLKNLLYYVANSASDGERTQQIKQAFRLHELLPDTKTLERARADLSGPNAQLMNTVSTVLLEDLTRVKDSLDVFVRAENRDVADLKPLKDTLKQMADTLGMLGLGVQRNVINKQLDILTGMIAGKQAVDEAVLMDMAGAMISIENSLSEAATARAANEDSEEGAAEDDSAKRLQGVEQQKLLQTVIDQAKIELARVKEALSDFSKSMSNNSVLQPIPAILEQIKGSIAILNLDRAAELLKQTTDYIKHKLLTGSVVANEDSLDNLADAISSIEYYLESLAGKWGNPDAILNVAEQSLAKLDITVGAATAEPRADHTQPDLAVPADLEMGPVDEDTLIDIGADDEQTLALDDMPILDLDDNDLQLSSLDDTQQNLSIEGLSLESVSEDETALPLGGESDDLSINFDNLDDAGLSLGDNAEEETQVLDFEDFELPPAETGDDDALELSLDLGEPVTDPGDADSLAFDIADTEALSLEESASVPAPASRAAATPAPPMEEVDDEIIEIFMEEAEEEYGNISRLLPQWINNPADENALKDMRRCFHTLKGSGRLVGAADVGEFAWAFENMLNRVIDHTIQPSPEMYEILQRGQKALPQMLELFKTGGKPSQAILTLMDQAEALSQGKSVVLEAGIPQEQSESPAETQIDFDPEATQIIELESAEDEDSISLDLELPDSDELADISVSADDIDLAMPLPDIDPVLLDIYRKEIDTHLNTLRNYVSGWRENRDRSASNDLLRALHTLTGSSRTTGVTQVSDLCSVFEKHIKDLQQYDQAVSEPATQILEQLADYIAIVVPLLDQPGAVIPDNSALLAEIQHLVDGFVAPDVSGSHDVSGLSAAAPQPQAAAELPADYDEELLDIFIEEGEEILEESDNTLHQWRDNIDDQELIEALQRQLHTLKGGARMAGVTEIGDLGHSIESMLTAVVDGHMPVSQVMFDLMQKSQDRLVNMLEQVKAHQRPAPGNDLILEVDSLLGRHSLGRPVEAVPSPGSATPVETAPNEIELTDDIPVLEIEAEDVITIDEGPEVEVLDNLVELDSAAERPLEMPGQELEEDDGSRDRRKAPRIQQEQVRVRADLLDNLVNFAGEVSIYRSRMEQQSNAFRFNLQELDDTVSRLREQLRQFEIEAETQIQFKKEEKLGGYDDFDPLEFDRFTQMQHLSRAMMESLNDLDSIKGILSGITRESETLLLQQSRVNTELQEGLMRTRMVPFSGQAPRLRRIVRQTADELGKKVELRLFGVDSELDRTVLDRIVPPIEHMLRNAIAHGIESPEVRRKTSKPEFGTIRLAFSREGSDIIIRISDDGNGINLRAIHKKAIERGLLKSGDKVTKDMLLNMIMESGFSTAEQVTQIAGRGVGMDVVNTEIKQLGGLLEIDTQEGKGTTFTISLPLTLAISRALMVNVGEDTYAVPLLNVQGVERINAAELMQLRAGGDPIYRWVNEDYPIMHLGSMLGTNAPVALDENDRVPLLMVRSGDYRAAIQVEGLMGSREIVVKPVGPQLSTLRGISGATIMGDGSVVLILDLAVLVRLMAAHDAEDVIDLTPETAPAVQTKPVVMVVDDSITVRKVTTRLLERHNFEVMAAKDGVDALAQLQERIPDVMLLDVEMPRMDGFELATNIRGDERLRHLPIIMITSRTGQKHRDRAMDIGVNNYMGKPYNDTTLLENINSLIGK